MDNYGVKYHSHMSSDGQSIVNWFLNTQQNQYVYLDFNFGSDKITSLYVVPIGIDLLLVPAAKGWVDIFIQLLSRYPCHYSALLRLRETRLRGIFVCNFYSHKYFVV